METTDATRGFEHGGRLWIMRRSRQRAPQFVWRALCVAGTCLLLSVTGSVCLTTGGPALAEAPPEETPSSASTEAMDIVPYTPPTATPMPSYDLYVRRMDFSTDTPQVNETVQLHIMLATDTYPPQGPFFPATTFRWRQGAGFPWHKETCPTNNHYANCTKTVQFSYQQPGIYQVQVEADHKDVVPELDESNNAASWTVTVTQPSTVTATPTGTPAPKYDIYVRRLDLQPAYPIVGDLIKAYIMLTSDTAPPGAPYFPASVFRWREGTQFPWHEEACPDNWQYARCDKTVQFSYGQPGDYTVEVEVDVYLQVDEADENNNAAGWLLSVGAAQKQDTSGPKIKNVSVEFRSEPSCQVFGRAKITDPSGVAWAQFSVRLDGGDWQSVWMSDQGGGNFESESGLSILMTSGSMEYYLIANDTLGNGNTTGGRSADYWMCGGG
jgi:hypothetical protein